MSHPASSTPEAHADSFSGPGSFIGKRVGPYTICLELASGGMASVFLARAGPSAERTELIALKVLHRHLAEQRDFVEMFMDEAQISSRIRHHNVCEVYGFDKVDDTYYLAMEYLAGESLSAVLRRASRRAIDLSKHVPLVVRVVADACAGSHAAHLLTDAQGKPLEVVHRDISPENLFVTYAGVTKVLDFGLACAKHQTHRTRTGVLKGKFSYLCPQALSGDEVDKRADIWGLGVVLWEALTGRRLFRGNSDLQTLTAVAEAPIQPPSAVRPELPEALDGPILRALSRNPAKRQASAEQLARELIDACPQAARIGEVEVADWMASLFGTERRWKSQVIELVQMLSRPDALLDLEFETAPTRVGPASLPPPSEPPRKRRFVLSGAAAALAALLAAASLVKLLPPVERADASELPPPRPPPEAIPPAPSSAPLPATAELHAEELSPGNGYLLEIVEAEHGKKGLVVRLKPDQPKHPPAAPSTMPSKPPPKPPARDEEDLRPPAWLREVMQQERAADLLTRWPPSASSQTFGHIDQ